MGYHQLNMDMICLADILEHDRSSSLLGLFSVEADLRSLWWHS